MFTTNFIAIRALVSFAVEPLRSSGAYLITGIACLATAIQAPRSSPRRQWGQEHAAGRQSVRDDHGNRLPFGNGGGGDRPGADADLHVERHLQHAGVEPEKGAVRAHRPVEVLSQRRVVVGGAQPCEARVTAPR